MYLKSEYPAVPPTPDRNVHDYIFNTATKDTPDLVVHVDVLSGRKRTRKEFEERVRDAATALGAPVSDGGMGLSGEAGDIVGICSGNCMVSTPARRISKYIHRC